MQTAELVSEDYYEEELQYQTVIDAKNKAEVLQYKPEYLQNKAGITLKFPKEILPNDKKASFILFRTDDANLDIKKDVTLNGANSFTIPAKILVPGSYSLKLKWNQNKTDYQLDYAIQWK